MHKSRRKKSDVVRIGSVRESYWNNNRLYNHSVDKHGVSFFPCLKKNIIIFLISISNYLFISQRVKVNSSKLLYFCQACFLSFKKGQNVMRGRYANINFSNLSYICWWRVESMKRRKHFQTKIKNNEVNYIYFNKKKKKSELYLGLPPSFLNIHFYIYHINELVKYFLLTCNLCLF